jgi:hypothetical protein
VRVERRRKRHLIFEEFQVIFDCLHIMIGQMERLILKLWPVNDHELLNSLIRRFALLTMMIGPRSGKELVGRKVSPPFLPHNLDTSASPPKTATENQFVFQSRLTDVIHLQHQHLKIYIPPYYNLRSDHIPLNIQ